MKRESFIAVAETELKKAFPSYPISLFDDPDDDSTFFAYVFCVPDGREQEFKAKVRAVIREKLDNYEWDVIPSIKNLTVTEKYYHDSPLLRQCVWNVAER